MRQRGLETLTGDYNALASEIARLVVNDGFLLDYEQANLKRLKKTRKALKTVLKYYLGDNWKEKL